MMLYEIFIGGEIEIYFCKKKKRILWKLWERSTSKFAYRVSANNFHWNFF